MTKPARTWRRTCRGSPARIAPRSSVNAPDGSPVGEREAGWVAQPAADEFKTLAAQSRAARGDRRQDGRRSRSQRTSSTSFVAESAQPQGADHRAVDSPAWHHPLFYLAIIACLVGEWGLRRWKGWREV